MNSFKNPFDPDNSQTKALLKQWIATKLKLSPHAVVEILEHHCSDSACLHAETIFRITDFVTEGPNLQTSRGTIIPILEENLYKIAKPLVFIRKWDLDNMKPYTTSPPPLPQY